MVSISEVAHLRDQNTTAVCDDDIFRARSFIPSWQSTSFNSAVKFDSEIVEYDPNEVAQNGDFAVLNVLKKIVKSNKKISHFIYKIRWKLD